jgi:UDP-N-acetylmuramoyl-tripeptide--D-alanyl-D-alanine ligase
MGAALVAGDPSQEFHGVSIDTRTLAAGDLFIAIRGERFDGAEFAEAAIGKGAAGVVVPRNWSATASAGRVVLEVDDPTLALQALGHAVRRESGTKVVAITGSAGKTTTKEVTAELLASRYRVVRNRGNLNNHIGLPLSLVELRQRPEIAVVELGMNHPGEISTLVRVAEPDVARRHRGCQGGNLRGGVTRHRVGGQRRRGSHCLAPAVVCRPRRQLRDRSPGGRARF